MTLARALHLMASTYGVPPHVLMAATPAELSFDYEVLTMGTAD